MTRYDPDSNKTTGHDADSSSDVKTTPHTPNGGSMGIDADKFAAVANTDDGDDDTDIGTDGDGDSDGDENENKMVRNVDGVVVGHKRDGLDALADADDPYKCIECGKALPSAHGLKSHFGQEHDYDPGDFDPTPVEPDRTDPDTGDDVEATDETLAARAQEKNKAEKSAAALWGEAEFRYNAASSSGDITKSDARDAVCNALETGDDWLSIFEESSKGDPHLARYDEENRMWDTDNIWTHVHDECKDRLGSNVTDRETDHIISELASRNRVYESEVNAGTDDRLLIPVKNGTLDLSDVEYDGESMTIDIDTVELLDPDRDRMWMYRIDTPWRPDDADLEGLDEWMHEVTHRDRDSDRRVLWEFGGHSLHPMYPSDGFLVLNGGGGSGKSQFIGLLIKMLGEGNTTSRSISDLQSRFGKVSGALDACANLNTELSGTKLDDLGDLKALTAGESTFMERKNVDGDDVQNTSTMIFASDNPPALPQENRALGRRLYPIEFPMSYVSDPDPDNPFVLQRHSKVEVEAEVQEAEGRRIAALIRAVEGLVRLLQEQDFTDDRKWEDRVTMYNEYADPIADYRRACLKHEPDAPGIHTNDLKTTYDAYAQEMGHEGKAMQTIKRQLQKLDIPIRKQRTRAYSDSDGKDTVYRNITFTREAMSFIPEDAYWDAGRYRDFISEPEQTGLDTNGDDEDDDDGLSVDGEVATGALEALEAAADVTGNGRTLPRPAAVGALVAAGFDVSVALQSLRGDGEIYEQDGDVTIVTADPTLDGDDYDGDDGDDGGEDGDGDVDMGIVMDIVDAVEDRVGDGGGAPVDVVIDVAREHPGVDADSVRADVPTYYGRSDVYHPAADRLRTVGETESVSDEVTAAVDAVTGGD